MAAFYRKTLVSFILKASNISEDIIWFDKLKLGNSCCNIKIYFEWRKQSIGE